MKNIQPKKFKIFVNSGLGMSLLMFNLRFCKYKDSFLFYYSYRDCPKALKKITSFFFNFWTLKSFYGQIFSYCYWYEKLNVEVEKLIDWHIICPYSIANYILLCKKELAIIIGLLLVVAALRQNNFLLKPSIPPFLALHFFFCYEHHLDQHEAKLSEHFLLKC